MDANVIAVHWPKGADNSNYFKAARNTELIGRQVGNLLEVAMSMGTTPDMIHLVGHSLGSQISNFAVNWLRQVSTVAPGFTPGRISGNLLQACICLLLQVSLGGGLTTTSQQ